MPVLLVTPVTSGVLVFVSKTKGEKMPIFFTRELFRTKATLQISCWKSGRFGDMVKFLSRVMTSFVQTPLIPARTVQKSSSLVCPTRP